MFLLSSSQHKQRSNIVPDSGQGPPLKKKKTWSPTCLCSDQKEDRTHSQKKKRNAIIVLCFSSPTLPTSIGEALQAATGIRPQVSGVPTEPTCQQGIRVLVLWPSTSSCQNPNPLLTSTTHSSHVCPGPQRRLLVRLISTARSK